MEIATEAEYAMRRACAEFIPFPSIVASGPRTYMVHIYPEGRKINKNEQVLLDIAASYEGYIGDISRMAYVGRPIKEHKRIFKIVYGAWEKAIEAIQVGVKVHELDLAARKYIERHGFERAYIYPTCRGMGMEVHEIPHLRGGEETVLEEGMVLHLLPGLYFKDIGGFRIEEMVLVTKKGAKCLTKFERNMSELAK